MNEPVLTIIMPLYNKEKYIGEALDSVFRQQTDYRYRVIVADDCSSDRSLEIVAGYERSHPGVITVLRSDRNLKLFRNVVRAYEMTKTPYFTVLDPDDYWTDGRLVEKAVGFLVGHPDFTIYSANTKLTRENGASEPYVKHGEPRDSDFHDFLAGTAVFGQTAGLFYRNVLFADGLPRRLSGELRPDQEMTFRGDAFRNIAHLHEGKVHYEPECVAVYRVTAEGLWQGISEFRRELGNCRLLLNFDEYYDGKHPEFLRMVADILVRVRRNLPEMLVGDGVGSGLREDAERMISLERELAARRSVAKPGPFNRWLLSIHRRLTRHLSKRGFIKE